MHQNMIEIEKIILEEIKCIYPPLKAIQIETFVSKLPISSRRLTFLSLFGSDVDLFNEIKVMLKMELISRMEGIDIAVERMRKYIAVSELEKKSFGEVFTPPKLVIEMLSKLPKEVWYNSKLKWFDHSCGTGIFPLLVIKKLMNTLKEEFPDENVRYKHIVENMIYACELQVKNAFLYMCAIDPKGEFKLNLYRGSFLEDGFNTHMKEVWKLKGFDVIMGNPPYQEQKPGFTKTQPLWNLFVKDSFKILSDGGYLVMVHPNGWRNIDGIFKDIQMLFRSNRLLSLNMNNVDKGRETFGASTTFDFYVLEKTKNDGCITKIINQKGNLEEIDISKMEIIPNFDILKINKLLASDDEDKVNVLYSRSKYGTDKSHMSKAKNDKNTFTCIYSVLKNNVPTFFYSTEDRGHFGIKKVIFGNGANPTFMMDTSGEYGLTQFAFGIVDNENFDIIKKVLEEKIEYINEITQATKFVATMGNPILYPKVVSLFRKDFWKEFIKS